MFDQYRHKLSYLTTTGGGRDPETGYVIPSQKVWSEPVPCRYENNSKARVFILPDMKAYAYVYAIFLPEEIEDIRFGTELKLINERGEEITTTSCKGRSVNQFNFKLWV
jgi:hypothetical protein